MSATHQAIDAATGHSAHPSRVPCMCFATVPFLLYMACTTLDTSRPLQRPMHSYNRDNLHSIGVICHPQPCPIISFDMSCRP
jgi:hypothetical protein